MAWHSGPVPSGPTRFQPHLPLPLYALCFNWTSLFPEKALCFPTSLSLLLPPVGISPGPKAKLSYCFPHEAFAVCSPPVLISPPTDHQEHLITFLLSLTFCHLFRLIHVLDSIELKAACSGHLLQEAEHLDEIE